MSKGRKKLWWKSWSVGGDPDRERFVAHELQELLDRLQDYGWTIVSIDKTNLNHVRSAKQGQYVSVTQYIIIGYYEK